LLVGGLTIPLRVFINDMLAPSRQVSLAIYAKAVVATSHIPSLLFSYLVTGVNRLENLVVRRVGCQPHLEKHRLLLAEVARGF
jgi:hypothetical protein